MRLDVARFLLWKVMPILLGLMAVVMPAESALAITWDPYADMSASPNSNSPWTFGWKGVGMPQNATFTPFSPPARVNGDEIIWSYSPGTLTPPWFGRSGGHCHWFVGAGSRPWTALRWKCPAGVAAVRIQAVFHPGITYGENPTGDIRVIKNGVPLETTEGDIFGYVTHIQGCQWDLVIPVVANDIIEFVVGDGGNNATGDNIAGDIRITSTLPPDGVLAGRMAVQAWLGDLRDVGLRIELYQGNSLVVTRRIFPDNVLGDFVIDNLVPGVYDVMIKGANTNRKKISNVTISSGSTTTLSPLPLMLVNGDVNGDNVINPGDVLIPTNNQGLAGD